MASKTFKVYQVRGEVRADGGIRLERLFYANGSKTFATNWDDYSDAVNQDSTGRARRWHEFTGIPVGAEFIGNYNIVNDAK